MDKEHKMRYNSDELLKERTDVQSCPWHARHSAPGCPLLATPGEHHPRPLRLLRLPPPRAAPFRGNVPVRARCGRDHRHRGEGDVLLHRPRRAGADPAAGVHRRRHARLRRTWHAHLAAAGESLFHRRGLPLRSAPGGPLPPVPPGQRGGHRRAGPGRGSGDHVRGLGSVRGTGLAGAVLSAQLHRLPGLQARLHPTFGGLLQATSG